MSGRRLSFRFSGAVGQSGFWTRTRMVAACVICSGCQMQQANQKNASAHPAGIVSSCQVVVCRHWQSCFQGKNSLELRLQSFIAPCAAREASGRGIRRGSCGGCWRGRLFTEAAGELCRQAGQRSDLGPCDYPQWHSAEANRHALKSRSCRSC